MKGFINKNQFIDFLKDGLVISVGGFLTNGTPEKLIDLVVESGVKDLTIICNDGGYEDKGVGKLIVNNQVKKLIASHIGTNPYVGKLMQEGLIEVELVPQGTLVERIRAFGAGLGGILTSTGLETIVEENKQKIKVNDKEYLLELALGSDMALIGGAIADQYGNLKYSQTMRNFNPIMATAAEMVIVEPFETVDVIDPENVITPYPFVDYILAGEDDE
ncbi:MAG: 3-oxoacid CoA-transferase subunit A [Candidatus Izemoplasmatales bacterium]|jgi:acetate CoA/acetoacetate CoA-transferase alpha subunit|nr:3-oxoacid CoA-transferase subunit A [Candidatus Izemoplasmatales bacterium]